LEGDDPSQVVAGGGYLLLGGAVVAQGGHLAERLPDRGRGDLGGDRGLYDERSGPASEGEAAVDAVGEAVFFAQAHIQPASEGATEDGVHDEEGEVVLVGAGDADVAYPDLGLDGA